VSPPLAPVASPALDSHELFNYEPSAVVLGEKQNQRKAQPASIVVRDDVSESARKGRVKFVVVGHIVVPIAMPLEQDLDRLATQSPPAAEAGSTTVE
jgi:hypothetical protein